MFRCRHFQKLRLIHIVILFIFLTVLQYLKFGIPHKTESEPSSPAYFSILTGVYVRDVFRANDTEIQIFFLRDFRNNVTVELKVGDEWTPFTSSCYYSYCGGILGSCTYMDYFGYAAIPASFRENVALIRLKDSDREYSFKIIDSRSDGTYKHELAAVLQPGYYVADWQNMIQFFETWLAHGATKFYVYHYSWSQQVQHVVDFYKTVLGSSLEVLPWSAVPTLPKEQGLFSQDANTRFFNLVSEASLNNALYRAKKEVKYLAMMDLDEIVGLRNGLSLKQFLRKLEKENELIAEIRFKWVHYIVKLSLETLEKPSDVNFDYLRSVQLLSNKSMHAGYFINGKCIHRPDRIRLVDTHNSIALDKDKYGRYYQGHFVDREVAFTVHIRRIVDAGLNISTIAEDDIIQTHSESMTESYKRRIFKTDFSEQMMSPWVSQYKSSLLTLHDCRRLPGGNFPVADSAGVMHCRSVRGCEQFMSGRDSFVFARMSWTNLAEPTAILGHIFNETMRNLN